MSTRVVMADTGFVIRPLSLEDVSTMAMIEAAAHSHPWSEAGLAECFGRFYRANGLFVCLNDGQSQMAGFTLVQQVVDEVSLLDICIAPEHQGKGLGRRLMAQLICDAKALAATVIQLEVRASNVNALGLYRQLGFIEAARRRGYYPTEQGSEDAILMDLFIEA